MNKYLEAEKWILDRGSHKGPYSLDKIEYLLDELGCPQREYACILIGGTNGKGSVTAITESILLESKDYNVGSYTSPHLLSLKERIKIQGKQISEKLVIDGVKAIKEITKVMDKESSIGYPAFFDVMTALGFWAFRESDIDIALVEVGLGGRFDATNGCEPEVSVITNIGTDHQQYLGDTKEKIAHEKLGIIRKNRPLLTTEKDSAVLEIFKKECEEKKAKLIVVEPNYGFELIESKTDGHYIKLPFNEEKIFFPMAGKHQLENLSLAIAIIEQMKKNGFEISNEAIIEGIKKSHWNGRLQFINGEPGVLLDGAHNKEGLEKLIEYLNSFYKSNKINIIFGALKDKPYDQMAKELEPFGNNLYFVPPNCPRSLTKEDFEKSKLSEKWKWFDDFKSALDSCKNDKEHNTLVCGSLYLISDALKELGC